MRKLVFCSCGLYENYIYCCAMFSIQYVENKYVGFKKNKHIFLYVL